MAGHIQDEMYRVVDDIIFYKDRIYLSPKSTLKENIMRDIHDTPLVGNLRYFKSYRKIWERLSLKGIKENVLQHVRECMIFSRKNQSILIQHDYCSLCLF
jgi:hypothetical protein